MSYQLTPKLRELTPYEPISGSYRIRLDANESYLGLSQPLRQEIAQAVSTLDYNRYPDPYCTELTKLAAGYFGVPAENITVGNGSDELISILASSFLSSGEKLLTVEPDFSMYRFYGSLFEANVISLPKREDLTIDVDALIDTANREGAAAILFSNPCNPTSIVLPRSEVLRLVNSVSCLVVVDEAYMDFSSDESVRGEVEQHDNLIVLKTCSKALGMAAVRLGFALANRRLTTAYRAAKSPYNVNSVSQAIGCVLLRHADYLRDCTRRIVASRQALCSGLEPIVRGKGLMLYQSSTNFAFLRCNSVEDAQRVHRSLLEESVAIRQMGPYLRVTAGSEAENAQVLKLLEEYL